MSKPMISGLPGSRRMGQPSGMAEVTGEGEKTLLEWAQRLCPETPRTRLKEWIAAGRFRLNGQVVGKAGLRLPDPGERLILAGADKPASVWAHRKRIHPKLVVLHLDDALAIVDKGSGMLSVPAEGHAAKSALQVLGDYLNAPGGESTRRRAFGSPAAIRPLPVHRLDQHTSGLFCLAMNEDARRALIAQLRSGELLREYVAFADGVVQPASGIWRHWLRLDDREFRQSLFTKPVEGSVEAITRYSVEKIYPRNHVSRLRLQLETGLRHQIRIQAAAAGWPLLGDRLYHPGTRKALQENRAKLPYDMQRQALHACLLGLRHPVSGRDLRFESPLPPDLLDLQQRLA